MSLIAKQPEDKEYELPPAEMTQAVCAYVVDCGLWEKTNDKGILSLKQMVRFVFELEAKNAEGKPFIMASKPFTNSLYETSDLSKFISAWIGKTFTVEERKAGFDLESLQGVNAFITPVHTKVGENTYANVGSITKIRSADKPMKKSIPELPKWLVDYASKAKVVPDWVKGHTATAPATTVKDTDGEELPF